MVSPDELDSRARQILRALVEAYGETGEPIASQALARQPGIVLSSASVRAVLGDLEALGYLDKPHASAGRVPTDKGFRFYANVLVRMRQVPPSQRELIDQRLDPARALAPTDLRLTDTSRLLHALTRHAGIVSTPHADERYRALDFVRLRENRVLAVFVSETGQVRNRLLVTDATSTQEELDRVSRYLKDLLGDGATLDELRQTLEAQLLDDRAQADALQATALQLGAQALSPEAPAAPAALVLVAGEASLLQDPRLSADLDKLRGLFKAIEDKQRLSRLLDRAAESREVTLFVGEETGLAGEGDVAMVAASYGTPERILGAIGVIGPARMAYGRVIPIVDYTARALSRTFEQP